MAVAGDGRRCAVESWCAPMKPLSADLRRDSPKTTAADARRGMVVPDPARTGYPSRPLITRRPQPEAKANETHRFRLPGSRVSARRRAGPKTVRTLGNGNPPCSVRKSPAQSRGDAGSRHPVQHRRRNSLVRPCRRNTRSEVFGVLMIVTASGMAFAHGSNDVANAIGPVAAIVGVVTTGEVASKSTVPAWVLLIGVVRIVVGLATFGYRVMATIGRKITEPTPSRGFAAEFAAACRRDSGSRSGAAGAKPRPGAAR